MCGRFVLKSPGDTVAELLDLAAVPELTPRYNIAPSQMIWAVRISDVGAARQLVPLRWGLIPHWAKSRDLGARLINARSETAAEKPAFRNAFRRRRCLVPADGYYEWAQTAGGKQPYYIHAADDKPFAIAGLYEIWAGPDGALTESCALLTTQASAALKRLHDRMPVILQEAAYGAWLDPALRDPEYLSSLFAPAPHNALHTVPVSRRVNSPRNDDPQCIAPAAFQGAQGA